MDVPAPNYKLSQGRFYLDIQGYQGVPADDGLNLTTLVRIHGPQEQPAPVQQAVVGQDNVQPEFSASRQPAPAQSEIQNNTLHISEQLSATGSQENEEVAQEEETPQEPDTTAVSEFEDLFEGDETTYTSHHMVAARGNDSYGTTAQCYDVEEDTLCLTNNNKEVNEHALMVPPSVQIWRTHGYMRYANSLYRGKSISISGVLVFFYISAVFIKCLPSFTFRNMRGNDFIAGIVCTVGIHGQHKQPLCMGLDRSSAQVVNVSLSLTHPHSVRGNTRRECYLKFPVLS